MKRAANIIVIGISGKWSTGRPLIKDITRSRPVICPPALGQRICLPDCRRRYSLGWAPRPLSRGIINWHGRRLKRFNTKSDSESPHSYLARSVIMEDTAYRAVAIVGAGAILPDAPN